jgi:DNA-directed RNA polymerase subunit L
MPETETKTKIDMDVKFYRYRPHDDIKRGSLEIECTGADCNVQFINALGRIAVDRLPMYAYAKELINIERINPDSGYHDSIPFNHDMMRDRLKNTPVMNVDPGFAILHERYWKDVDYLSSDREVYENEKKIEVYIDAKNTAVEGDDESILHVTTDHAKVYIDDELTTIYSKEYPLLLISLKPKEAFKCSMKAVLGVGVNDTCWDACSNFCYDQETIPESIIVKFQAASQFNEFVLVDRALEYFRYRTLLLKDEIHRMYLADKQKTERFQIIINDEDHTMGEPINYEMQSHPEIRKSSCTKPNHLLRQIVIDVVAFDKDKLLNAMMESIDNLVAKIDRFEELFNEIDRSESGSDSKEPKTKKTPKAKKPQVDTKSKKPSKGKK